MPKLIQINTTANWGSTGRIAEEIGLLVQSKGWESYIAYSRGTTSQSHLIKIGNKKDMYLHGLQTRILDNHGLASRQATCRLVEHLKEIRPDIIHLHNIHGYYLNYPILFNYLKEANVPVVWTLHDCWSFTGHCAYFSYEKCEQWKTGCSQCLYKHKYPRSLFVSRSIQNYKQKKNYFTALRQLVIVPVSEWLSNLLRESFFQHYDIRVIQNGIDLSIFKPSKNNLLFQNLHFKYIVLGVASVWEERKGLNDFIRLRKLLSEDYIIVLIGLTSKQINSLPTGFIGIQRTNNINELASYYSTANVFLNPTWEDNFPTTNLEALACGTPVITYRTGGSIEAVDDKTGIIVEPGNVKQLAEKIQWMCNRTDFEQVRIDCRKRAVELFDKKNRYEDYYQLYMKLIKDKNEEIL